MLFANIKKIEAGDPISPALYLIRFHVTDALRLFFYLQVEPEKDQSKRMHVLLPVRVLYNIPSESIALQADLTGVHSEAIRNLQQLLAFEGLGFDPEFLRLVREIMQGQQHPVLILVAHSQHKPGAYGEYGEVACAYFGMLLPELRRFLNEV